MKGKDTLYKNGGTKWGRGTGWEGFTKKVAFNLRPKEWCNLARNAEGERHCKQRDCHVQRGREREELLKNSGYWKGSCIRWKWDLGLHPSQNLAMVPAHTMLLHTAVPLSRWVLYPHASAPSRFLANPHSSSTILLGYHFPSPVWLLTPITQHAMQSPVNNNLACIITFVYLFSYLFPCV